MTDLEAGQPVGGGAVGRWLTGWRVYSQLADRLRERITSGAYPVGTYLPSETALSKEYGVARNTVRRALGVLVEENLLVTIRSKGYLVLREEIRHLDREYLYQAIAAELRAQIECGRLPLAGKVSSERDLRRHYAASRTTVRQALGVLESEGLIVAVHGKGRFVRPDWEGRLKTSKSDP
ncbi:GntR family transcriptional regulator [Sphaerisporangium rhizosphaerae]|uniref:GntR family transcriptional regulator n=1 Tax=Sphaerisporangium rhizosphaerae TaxID=2269375 RepID=A0ABW2P5Q1_9ACTN